MHMQVTSPGPWLGEPAPSLTGCRVRLFGLKARLALNEKSGVARRWVAAKGRYEVAVEGEAEAVLLKPANLQELIEPALHSP